MALASGTKLGPYVTQSLLGAGGMGEVYRARDTRLGRDVAIKILAQHLSSQPELKERFDREARAISSLNHPRICTLHDIGHQNGVDFLVMEYLEGESLADRLKKGPLPLKETLKIGMEVCEALEVAHRAGITHRDLKSANIMLTRSGAKLMDFGLAKSAVAGLDGDRTSAVLLSGAKTLSGEGPLSPLTTAGAVIGTIQYMSPEQIEGKPADQRSDLFALGAVLYEMATGKRPFDGKSQISVASAILEKDPEPISTIQPVTPLAFEHVVRACLEKNPEDRFQSARDVRLELKWIAGGEGQLAAQVTTPVAQKAHSILPWCVAAILAMVAGGAVLWASREKPQPRFTNVTFREGALQAARFSRDGQTIVYSGEWEGQPPEVAVARVGSPESRLLGIPSATIASVSTSDELAVFLGCEQVFLIDCRGTLATVSLAGGAPRGLAEHVAYADWNPDGKQLAISVFSGEGARLEFPPGHVLCQQNAGWFGHPRFSPDGSRIAFENHPVIGNDEGALELVDLSGKRTVLVPDDVSLEGVAWSPDGKEIWYAGTNTGGWADTIFAVSLSGKKRSILTMPYLRLHDIAKDGRILLSHESWRRQLKGFFPGDKIEHTYSWLDDTEATAISDDGRSITFTEAGETFYLENDYMAYYRTTDGSPAALLGAGTAPISPDGRWLLSTSAKSHKLQLQPIGPGESRELPTPGLKSFDHQGWSGDGRQVVYEAQTDQNDWNVYEQRIDGGPPALVKAGARNVFPLLSHDGELLALHEEQGGISLYRAGNPQPIAMKGVLESEYPVRFPTGGRSLLVGATSGHELVLTLVDLASGHRESWKRVPIEVQAGGQQFAFTVTPDLKYYAYSSPRYTSDLYIVDNLH
jgi:eukaryotic-like serine/threonine-protein kinase